MQREEDKSNPASVERSSRSVTHTSSIRIGNHIPLAEEQRILACLKWLFLAMLVTAGTLLVLAWVGWRQTQLYQLFVLGCFVPLAVGAAVVSFVGVTRAQAELGDRAALLSRVKGTVGEDIAQFGLYATMCAFAGLLLLGCGCLLYQDQLDLLTSAEAADAEVWAQQHPTDSPETIRAQLRLYLLAAGGLCALYCLLGLLAFAKQVVLSVDNESQHVLVQVLSFIQLSLGLLLLFSAGFTHKAKEQVGIEGVEDSFLWLLALSGLCAVLTALLGFRAANKELVFDIAIYILLVLVSLVFTVYLAYTQLSRPASDPKDLSEGCLDSLALIDEHYLGFLGCSKKYQTVSPSVSSLSCLKSQVRSVWERPGDYYGCINVDCCGYFLSAAKSIDTYSSITLVGCATVELLALVAAGFLIAKIVSKGQSIFHEADGRVFFLMLVAGVVGGGLIFASVVFTPYAQPLVVSPVVVGGAGKVDAALLGAELCLIAPQIHLPDSLSNCSDCESASFRTEIEAQGGHMRLSNPANVTVLKSTATSLWFQTPSPALLSSEVRQTWFCPDCPDTSGSLNITITREIPAKPLRFLRALQTSSTTLFSYFSPISFLTTSTDRFVGTVVSAGQAIAGANLQVQQMTCRSLSVQTDSAGRFNFSLPANIDYSPSFATVLVSKAGFEPVMWTVAAGGVPLGGIEKRAEIDLVQEGSASLKVSLSSAFRNKQIDHSALQIRTGYGNFKGPVLYSYNLNSTKSLYIASIPAGVYSLSAVAAGFARADTEVALYPGKTLSKALLLSPLDLTPDQIRITLTWTGENVDLDLKAAFSLNANLSCLVGYNQRLCAGAKLIAESGSGAGGEAITLQQVGPFQYLLYVQGNRTIASAELALYTSLKPYAILRLKAPRSDKTVWNAFCLNGLEGVGTLLPLSLMTEFPVDPRVCQEAYGPAYAYSSQDKGLTLEQNSTAVPLPGAFQHWLLSSN